MTIYPSKTYKEVIEEIIDETIKLYNSHPHLSIFKAIEISKTITENKYKGVEIVEEEES